MKIKLEEVITEFIVPMRDKPKIFNGHIPWCRIEDIEGKYLFGTKSNKYVSEETINSMNLRIIPSNSVLCTCSATIGVTAITKIDLCTNQTFIGLVPSDRIDCDYLYYYLGLCKERLVNLASITTIPYISREQFKEFEIDYFDIDTQHKITNILSLIDSKIEVIRRINIELESIAKTIYDYWFIQFDFPNEKGEPYKSSGGKLVWNDRIKRAIPIDWEMENIESCCSVIDTLHSKKPEYKYEDDRYYLLQLENIQDDGLINLANKFYVSKKDYKQWTSRVLVSENDLLITNAGRVAATAQIPKGIESGIGRNITAIRPISINPTYLFWAFRGWDMKRQIKWNTDLGAFFSSLNVNGIKKLFFVRSRNRIESMFAEIITPMMKKRDINNTEIQTLTELRNWLLPMLMNGQVKVK